MNNWDEYTDVVYATLPSKDLSFVQSIYEITKRLVSYKTEI
jgi:hypothetical protein